MRLFCLRIFSMQEWTFIVRGRVAFGEITFPGCAGFGMLIPEEFVLEMGSYLVLQTCEAKNKWRYLP